MNSLKLGLIGLVVPILGLLATAPAIAQTQVTVEPSNLTLVGTRNIAGVGGTTETRTLFLRTTSPIRNLQLIPLDLNNAGGIDVLPAQVIQPTLSAQQQIEANGLVPLPVAFQLGDAAHSGEFSGTLLVRYEGGELTIPLIVRVKDPPLPPLLVLVTGVVLGIGVSTYRTKGRPRDEILVRVGQLRTQLRTDMDLQKAKPFGSEIESHLLDVEMAIQAERWDDARQAVEQAEAVWLKWRKGHDDWLEQLNYRDELERRIQEETDPDIPYMQFVRRNIQQAVREAPVQTPNQLHEQLNTLRQQVNQYLQLKAKLDRLNEQRTQLPPDKEESWRLEVQDFEQRLNTLDPSDKDGYETLQREIQDAIAQLQPLIPQQRIRGLAIETPKPIPPAPPTRLSIMENRATRAKIRLQLFGITSYAIAVTLLAGAGFIELYINQPTFGANLWIDYFTLLAWGFGAEATRASITKVVQNWGLPTGE